MTDDIGYEGSFRFKIAVVVDMQNDFMDKEGAALPVTGASNVAITVDEYLKELTLENGYVAVLFTADTHDDKIYPDSDEAKQFPPHCYAGTDGFNFSINPKNVPSETPKFILNKSVFNMWTEPELTVRPFKVEGEIIAIGGEKTREEFFQQFIDAGIVDAEVCGVAADYCVKDAISGLVARGFEITIFDNLTAGIVRDIHQVVKEEFGGQNVRVA